MTDINRTALSAKCQPDTINRAILNKRTTKASVKSALAKEGIHVELITMGAWMPDRPICKTDNAFKAFARNRKLRAGR
jgi:hypothetical protein